MPYSYPPVLETLVPHHDINCAARQTEPKIPPRKPTSELLPRSVHEGSFASSRSSFQKARVEYSILCWSTRWSYTPELPLLIGFASIHPGFLVHHPSKSPFAPISRIAEGQLFEIWEYYLILERGWVGRWLLSAYFLTNNWGANWGQTG